jgi:hypothetical protein
MRGVSQEGSPTKMIDRRKNRSIQEEIIEESDLLLFRGTRCVILSPGFRYLSLQACDRIDVLIVQFVAGIRNV